MGVKPVTKIEIGAIRIDENVLIRPIDDEHVNDLVKNINEIGQINPIIVEEYKQGLYHVIAHAHEFKALQIHHDKMKSEKPTHVPKIFACCFEGDEVERKKVQLTENILRKPMCMEEVGAIVDDLIKRTGKTQIDIAEELGWSRSYISECISEHRGKPKNRQNDCSTVEHRVNKGQGKSDLSDSKAHEPQDGGVSSQGEDNALEPTETPNYTEIGTALLNLWKVRDNPGGIDAIKTFMESLPIDITDQLSEDHLKLYEELDKIAKKPEKKEKKDTKLEKEMTKKVKPVPSNSQWSKLINEMEVEIEQVENSLLSIIEKSRRIEQHDPNIRSVIKITDIKGRLERLDKIINDILTKIDQNLTVK